MEKVVKPVITKLKKIKCFYKHPDAVSRVKYSGRFLKILHLFRFEASEAEHSDLVDDVLPVAGGAFLLQAIHQLFPHLNDAVRHAVHLLQPLIEHNRD